MQLFRKGILPTILHGCHRIVAVQCHRLDFATISPTSGGRNAERAHKSQNHPKSAKMLANPEYGQKMRKKCQHFWAGAIHDFQVLSVCWHGSTSPDLACTCSFLSITYYHRGRSHSFATYIDPLWKTSEEGVALWSEFPWYRYWIIEALWKMTQTSGMNNKNEFLVMAQQEWQEQWALRRRCRCQEIAVWVNERLERTASMTRIDWLLHSHFA